MPASANELYLAVQQARALSEAGLVPQVTGLRLVSSTTDTNGTVATLVWTHPEAIAVDHYEVFTKNLLNSNEQPLFATAVTGSPAVVRLTPTQTGNVTVAVQVVLPDGRRSDLGSAPTVVPTASQDSLTPAAIPMETPFVSGLVLTNNSPSAGRITWSACTLYYNGVTYTIPSGSTSTTNKYVTWTVGASVFVAADTYTAGPTVFPIATNTSGTGDVAWNKLAKSGVQEEHLGFALNAGYQIQNAASRTMSVTYAPDTTYTQAIITAPSEAGYLIAAAVRVTAIGSNDIVPTFFTTFYLRLQVDGAVPTDIPLFKTSANGSVLNNRWDTTAYALANDHEGSGSAVGNFLTVPLGITYKSSMNAWVVQVQGSGNAWTTNPGIEMSLIRAVKVN